MKSTILSFQERLVLIGRVLPEGVGSFKQMETTADLRERVEFTDEEKKSIDLKQSRAGINFNPEKLEEQDNLKIEVELSEDDLEVIGFGFRKFERDAKGENAESIPTDKTFVDLYRKFKDHI